MNLADELYAAGDVEGNDESCCTVDEFELMVGRVAHEKLPGDLANFVEALDTFITLQFVPIYRKALRKRGIVVPLEIAFERSLIRTIGEENWQAWEAVNLGVDGRTPPPIGPEPSPCLPP